MSDKAIKSKDWKFRGNHYFFNIPRNGYLVVHWQTSQSWSSSESICWYHDYLNCQREMVTHFDLHDFAYRPDGPSTISIHNGKVNRFYRNMDTIREFEAAKEIAKKRRIEREGKK